ncbi:MAG TPA: diguanylate cyclase [Methylococcaceae bacterium]|nr:diguanylate cyclase [Methylococcaceae bacterium]
MKILIVEDDAVERTILQTMLRGTGFDRPVFAASVAEARRLLGLDGEEGETDLGVVLLDIDRNGKSGIEACRSIKADSRLEGVMVVLASSQRDSTLMQAAFAAGAMDFVAKPWNAVELLARLRSAESLAETQQRLRASEHHLHVVTEAMGDGLLVLDREGKIAFVNPAAERLLGWPESELLGTIICERVRCNEAAHEFGMCPLMRTALSGEVYRGEDLIFHRADGGEFAVAAVASPLREKDEVSGAVVVFHDISVRKRAEGEARLMAKIIEYSPAGIMVTDRDTTIRLVNPAFSRVTGYTAAEAKGQTPQMLKSGRQDAEFYAHMWSRLEKNGYWEGELWNRRKDGGEYPEWLSVAAIAGEDGETEKYLGMFTDITERRRAEDRLRHLASHDVLTNLPNRIALMNRLEEELNRARRIRSQVGLLFIDLDRFKPVNDQFGHAVGDAVLDALGKRLRGAVRDVDYVARLGGDEFVAVLVDADNLHAFGRVARKLLGLIEQPFEVGGNLHRLSASIGIAVFPQDAQTPDGLLDAADSAMYAAKSAGRSRFIYRGERSYFSGAAEGDTATATLAAEIFKAYDIRGIVDRTLTADGVRQIGRGLGTLAAERGLGPIVVGRDGRLSGPALAGALSEGIRASGVDVLDIGLAPTPVTYFAAFHLDAGGAVSVTGSHNPPDYNGLKMVLGGETLYGEAIQDLRRRIETAAFAEGDGAWRVEDVQEAYLARIAADVKLARPMKIVVDCGSGVAGAYAPELFRRLGCEVIELFCEVDGLFPHHHPDPSQPENLQDLVRVLKESGAEIGLAFDGDGDRLGVVTRDGEIVYPDRQLMLFAADVLERNPGATIIYDVKCTRLLAPWIRRHGGEPLMWRTGHAPIKAKLRETGAPLAGEMSGHIFFKERWYGFDDGLYAGARLLEILARAPDANPLLKNLPDSVSTPELHIPMAEGEPFALLEKLKRDASFEGAEHIVTLDGLRVEYADGFGLARPSNTTPVVVLRFEADNPEALARIQAVFRDAILQAAPDAGLPF